MNPLTTELAIGLSGGLLGSAHCVAMCGGFVLYLSRERRMVHELLWHAGRIGSYLTLGAVAGFAGSLLEGWLARYAPVQQLLGYLAGAVMVLMGLTLLGLRPVQSGAGEGWSAAVLRRIGRGVGSIPSPGTALVLGLASGLLPCPMVLALIAYGLQSESVAAGMATMGALGAGTALPLLLVGALARRTLKPFRRWGAPVGGAILIVLGVTTALRGTGLAERGLCVSHRFPLPEEAGHRPGPVK